MTNVNRSILSPGYRNWNVRNYEDVFGQVADYHPSESSTDYDVQLSDFNAAVNLQTVYFNQDTSDLKMRLDVLDSVRQSRDLAEAGVLDQVAGDDKLANELLMSEEEAPPPYESIVANGEKPQIQAKGWFIPALVAVAVGAAVGTATHAAWSLAETHGEAEVVDQYHEVANHVYNQYVESQTKTMPGEKYVGRHNYESSMAALQDARDQAQPWLMWGPGPAINHFETEREYDKMVFSDNNGYAISIQTNQQK